MITWFQVEHESRYCRTLCSGANVAAGRPTRTALKQSMRKSTRAETSRAETSRPSCRRTERRRRRWQNMSAQHARHVSALTAPSASRSTVSRDHERRSHGWTTRLFTMMNLVYTGIVNRFFMKLFRTNDIRTVKDCMSVVFFLSAIK